MPILCCKSLATMNTQVKYGNDKRCYKSVDLNDEIDKLFRSLVAYVSLNSPEN